jgi:hypothetical protein
LQIMWAHSHLIRVEGIGYLQLLRAKNADVCRRPLQVCLRFSKHQGLSFTLDLPNYRSHLTNSEISFHNCDI